jgi:hypothetical protein
MRKRARGPSHPARTTGRTALVRCHSRYRQRLDQRRQATRATSTQAPPDGSTRTFPWVPALTRLLRRHLEEIGLGPDKRVFWGARGGVLPTCTYHRAWHKARKAVLTDEEYRSPLAKRSDDLRHACVSTWPQRRASRPPKLLNGPDTASTCYSVYMPSVWSASTTRPSSRSPPPCVNEISARIRHR